MNTDCLEFGGKQELILSLVCFVTIAYKFDQRIYSIPKVLSSRTVAGRAAGKIVDLLHFSSLDKMEQMVHFLPDFWI